MVLNSDLMIPDFPLRKTHFKRQFQNLEITHESSEIAGDKKVTQRAKTFQTYLSCQAIELQLEKIGSLWDKTIC